MILEALGIVAVCKSVHSEEAGANGFGACKSYQ